MLLRQPGNAAQQVTASYDGKTGPGECNNLERITLWNRAFLSEQMSPSDRMMLQGQGAGRQMGFRERPESDGIHPPEL